VDLGEFSSRCLSRLRERGWSLVNSGLESTLFLRSFILDLFSCLVLDSLLNLVHLLCMLKELSEFVKRLLILIIALRRYESLIARELAAVIRNVWFECALR
jgi:hypothetical protein